MPDAAAELGRASRWAAGDPEWRTRVTGGYRAAHAGVVLSYQACAAPVLRRAVGLVHHCTNSLRRFAVANVHPQTSLRRTDLQAALRANPAHGRERPATAGHGAAVDSRAGPGARDQSDDSVEGLQPARDGGCARAPSRQADDGREAAPRAVAPGETSGAARAADRAPRPRGPAARGRRGRGRRGSTQRMGDEK